MVVHKTPQVAASRDDRPFCHDVLPRVCVTINKDSVDVVGAVVALEGGDVRTEVVGWDDEDVSILVSVVGTMPGCAVADGEPGSLVADQLQRLLVFGIQYLVFSICKERPMAKKETLKQKWGKPHNN